MLGPVSRFFEGEATSEVGLEAGLRRDVWVSVAPDTRRLEPRVKEGDEVFAAAEGDLVPAERDAFLAEALRGLVRSYTDAPPPATFRLLVSPMVTWIWIGALVVFLGGLIALWPSPRTVGRRVSAACAARRVGREARTSPVVDRLPAHPRRARPRGAAGGGAAARAAGGRRGRERRAGRARGGARRQVPRDPRRGAGLPDRQAVAGRLARARPRSAARRRSRSCVRSTSSTRQPPAPASVLRPGGDSGGSCPHQPPGSEADMPPARHGRGGPAFLPLAWSVAAGGPVSTLVSR